MSRIGTIMIASGVGLLGPALATAQTAEVGLLAGQVADEHGGTHAGVTVAPAVMWSDAGTAVRLSGHGSLFEGGLFGGASLAFGAEAVRVGPLQLVVGGDASAAASAAGYRSARAGAHPRLRLSRGRWGVEGGPGWTGGGEWTAGEAPVAGAPAGLGALGGARPSSGPRWRSETGLAASAWVSPGPVTLSSGWRTLRSGELRWQEWSAAAALQLGAGSVALRAGQRTGALRESWLAASASVELGGTAALVAEAGAFPSDPLTGRAAGRYASAGVRLRMGSGGAAAALPPALSDGRLRLTLRADPGAEVELLADWTEWEARPVSQARPGWYEVEVTLPAGTHRFLFRVNGEWRLPEGVETEPDGFGGKHGVVRVRAA